jgi:hypothetical protein
MIASRASAPLPPRRSRRIAAALLLAGGTALAAAPGAQAQGNGGGAPAQEDAGPIPLFPPTVRPGESAGERAPDGTSGAAGDVEVNRLGELDLESLGILDAANGGLGGDAWAGSDRATVEALLRELPGDLSSPTLRGLAARLLLSSARAPAPAQPQGAAPTMADAVAAAQASDFLRLRAERLYALGEIAGLNRLLGLVPQRVEDPWLAEARVDGLLLAGRDAEACALVPAGLARYPQALTWAKVQVFCQFADGQTDQAMLGLDLLREQAPDSDPAFFEVANGFVGGTAPAGNPRALVGADLTPLTLAMLRKTGGALPPEAVASASPPLLHGIAALAGSDPAVHAGAVERLVEIGALPGERLAGTYDAFEFTEAELADALAGAERAAQGEGGGEGGGVRGRALLYRAANRESLAATRAEILRVAFLSAEADGRSTAMARAAVPLLEDLAPTPELAWFAPLAARTLYRAGQFERAAAWLSVLRLDGQHDPESQQAYDALRPLQRLAGGPEPLAVDGAAGPQRLLPFVLSRALGQAEDLARLAVDDGGSAQSLERLPLLLALGDAAAAGRRGESVLLAVTALGPAAPAGSHPLALGYAVSALSAVGLGADARALAIEAALAAGL